MTQIDCHPLNCIDDCLDSLGAHNANFLAALIWRVGTGKYQWMIKPSLLRHMLLMRETIYLNASRLAWPMRLGSFPA